MKKILLGCTLAACSLVGQIAHADTLLGGYAGAQVWQMGVDGGFANQSSLTEFSYADKTNAYFYAAIEHPVPLLPNIKVARTGMDSAGVSRLNASFSFAGQLYLDETDLNTELEMSSTDIILYYEILDNDLVSFDIGVNGKQVDGTIMVSEVDGTLNSMQDFSGIVPMLYSKLAIGLPLSGLGAYVEGSYLALDDNTLSDFQAAITYNLAESLAVDLSLQAGFRSSTMELDDFDDVFADLEFSGVFVGLKFDF